MALHTDLLSRILSECDSVLDVARASMAARDSLDEALRLRAAARGYDLAGERCDPHWRCFVALQREANLPRRAAAGYQHSIFVDGDGLGSRRAARKANGLGTAGIWPS